MPSQADHTEIEILEADGADRFARVEIFHAYANGCSFVAVAMVAFCDEVETGAFEVEEIEHFDDDGEQVEGLADAADGFEDAAIEKARIAVEEALDADWRLADGERRFEALRLG